MLEGDWVFKEPHMSQEIYFCILFSFLGNLLMILYFNIAQLSHPNQRFFKDLKTSLKSLEAPVPHTQVPSQKYILLVPSPKYIFIFPNKKNLAETDRQILLSHTIWKQHLFQNPFENNISISSGAFYADSSVYRALNLPTIQSHKRLLCIYNIP